MGLFSRRNSSKPSEPAQKKPQAVNADDIWNTPSTAKRSGDTAFIKEGNHDSVHGEKIKDNMSIEPEMIKSKMAELEKELEEKSNKKVKTYADYDKNPVQEQEIHDAQDEYEKLYEAEHEKFVASHKEDISVAKESNLEEKMQDMYKEHDERQSEEKAQYSNIKAISGDETAEKLSGLSYAKKPEDYAEYKDIKSVSVDQSEVDKLGSIDHSEDPDEIGSVSESLLAEKVDEFNKKYGK